ncbi:MAG: hypothetical protein ACKO3W_00240 [bacterium]
MTTRAASRNAAIALFVVSAALVAAACAPSKRPASAGARAPVDAARERSGRVTTTLGLELVRWHVALDPKVRQSAIAQMEENGAAVRIPSELSRDSVVLLRAKTARLAEIAALFEGPRAARRTALGQTEVFTDLATVELGRDFVVFSDGRPERSSEGLLRLAMRGWCFPTVDAAAARIELRLGITPNRLAGVSLDPSAARERMIDLPGRRVKIELANDESLILLEAPFVPPEPEKGADPPALPPPSRAALLFDGRPFPDRALVLVIEPKFADILPGSPGVDPTLRDGATEEATEETTEEVPEETTAQPPATGAEAP